MFQFKEFSIYQQKSAMKVGTDGVLLGAWVPIAKETFVLDIGTGTGLIALMLAQRNNIATIDAIEIDKDACEEAILNFKKSPWLNRLNLFNGSIKSYHSLKKYDLIISNPPYFTDTFKASPTQRTLARHVGNLSFKELLFFSNNLLKENGACAFIIPFSEEENFIYLAKIEGLFPKQITRVKGREDATVKRSLLYFTKQEMDCDIKELIIEIDRHVYTTEYINLTKSFYLKM